MEIRTYHVTTGAGHIMLDYMGNYPLPFVPKEKRKDFSINDIKYLGDNFKVEQVLFDNGSFEEQFIVTQVIL